MFVIFLCVLCMSWRFVGFVVCWLPLPLTIDTTDCLSDSLPLKNLDTRSDFWDFRDLNRAMSRQENHTTKRQWSGESGDYVEASDFGESSYSGESGKSGGSGERFNVTGMRTHKNAKKRKLRPKNYWVNDGGAGGIWILMQGGSARIIWCSHNSC